MSTSNIEQLRQDWHHAQNFIASRKKFFIVGSPKSGTTWLLNLLNGHPEIVVNGEGRFTWRLVPWLAQAVKAFNDDQAKFVGKEVTYLRDVDLQMAARMLIDIQLCRYIETSGKPLFSVAAVGDKTPQHAMSMPLLSQFYPDAQFLHIVRDPRDAATSGWHHFGPDSQKEQQDYLPYFIREVWSQAVGAAREAGKTLGEQRYLEIRYEDLHADEPAHVQRCLDFLRIDSSPANVQACINAGSFKQRSGGRERGEEDPKNFYRRGIVADWTNHMTPEAAATYCEPIAPLMRECGYDPLAGLQLELQMNPSVIDRVANPSSITEAA
jgi:hypothetical protein